MLGCRGTPDANQAVTPLRGRPAFINVKGLLSVIDGEALWSAKAGAEPYAYGAAEYVALELFLKSRRRDADRDAFGQAMVTTASFPPRRIA
jgi:hypothetical protein